MGKIIKSIKIKNFRGIKNKKVHFDNLTMFIGDNGTNKTSILEAVNFVFSPAFLSARIKSTDFYDGTTEPIEIEVEFENPFIVKLPDGYTTQDVECNKINLIIKKRERKTPGKILSDLVTIEHYVVPSDSTTKAGNTWIKKRKNDSEFKFDKRLLSFNVFETEQMPRTFYFNKERDKQIYRGFNTSFSAFIEDLNWRFLRELLNANNMELYEKIDEIENKIAELSKVENHDVIKNFNDRITRLGLAPIDFSFIDRSAPFEQAFLSRKLDTLNIPLKNLGSGIEMIYAILFLETLASLSREKLIILIDEPELHLHPKLQGKFADYIYELSKDDKYQIIITTHSPIFFKNLCDKENVTPIIATNSNNEFELKNYEQKASIFPWGPTWGEIIYFAFEYPTIEFHNELYGYLQEITGKTVSQELDDYLESEHKISKDQKWIPERDGQAQSPKKVTLMTFIRHKIHHPENKTMQSVNYTNDQLKNSIDKMIELIREIKK